MKHTFFTLMVVVAGLLSVGCSNSTEERCTPRPGVATYQVRLTPRGTPHIARGEWPETFKDGMLVPWNETLVVRQRESLDACNTISTLDNPEANMPLVYDLRWNEDYSQASGIMAFHGIIVDVFDVTLTLDPEGTSNAAK